MVPPSSVTAPAPCFLHISSPIDSQSLHPIAVQYSCLQLCFLQPPLFHLCCSSPFPASILLSISDRKCVFLNKKKIQPKIENLLYYYFSWKACPYFLSPTNPTYFLPVILFSFSPSYSPYPQHSGGETYRKSICKPFYVNNGFAAFLSAINLYEGTFLAHIRVSAIKVM